jgi:D-alanine-D-alanine ligase
MSGRRLRVALVYGGRSAEREVSFMSARTVAAALDPAKYERVLVEIDPLGRWCLGTALESRAAGAAVAIGPARAARGAAATTIGPVQAAAQGAVALGKAAAPARLAPLPDGEDLALAVRGAGAVLRGVDLIFPLLHGPYGEDGSIQGLARMADLPCVGADVLGSALCMDKDAAKRLMREAGIPVAPFVVFRSARAARSAWAELELELGSDLFVKPANLGSSVGVSRVRSRVEYEAAVETAFAYDTKILVEKRIVGREIEVAVLGNESLRASLPGEVAPKGAFYDYESKYVDEEGAEVIAPAKLSFLEAEACRKLALDACRVLCVGGMARVDMFLGPEGAPIANEVNTIPGFTSRSMYPLLWEASGMSLGELVDELVSLALEARGRRSAIRSTPPVATSATSRPTS